MNDTSSPKPPTRLVSDKRTTADSRLSVGSRPGLGNRGFTAAVREVAGGFYSLLVGMRVTIAEFFKPTVTVHYPHESLKMTERYRGHIELVRDPETGKSLCIACKACEKACPSECIFVEGIKREGEKKRSPTGFTLDFTKCSLCGSCVEVCPTDGLCFSKEYNLASTNKNDFLYDLLKRSETQKK